MTPWRRTGCLRRFHPRPESAARIVCFPHAGGVATTFREVSASLPTDVELIAVQYPGRYERHRDAMPTSLRDLADEAAADLRSVPDGPTILFGHSMGALVAFETALRLEANRPIVRLFASAAWPPSRDWHEPDLDGWDDAAVIADLRRLGGLGDELLGEDDVLRDAIRTVRADQRLIRSYRADGHDILTSPITAVLGDADPKNNVEQVSGWAAHTAAGLTVEVLSGGHFYLRDRPTATAELITTYVDADRYVREGRTP